jgi:hypothetical protein
MLKGVTGPEVKYDIFGMQREYNGTSHPAIRGYVDTWYADLNSPILKRIAWKVNLSETRHPSWPGNGLAGATNFEKVAFIPMLSDIDHLMKANGYRYWLSDIHCGCSIIKANGDSSINGNIASTSSTIYARPCIWVTTKK